MGGAEAGLDSQWPLWRQLCDQGKGDWVQILSLLSLFFSGMMLRSKLVNLKSNFRLLHITLIHGLECTGES